MGRNVTRQLFPLSWLINFHYDGKIFVVSLEPTGLSLIKNCNFEAGKLRADVQFKFNLSPDW
jgi:hypothetical protein